MKAEVAYISCIEGVERVGSLGLFAVLCGWIPACQRLLLMLLHAWINDVLVADC